MSKNASLLVGLITLAAPLFASNAYLPSPQTGNLHPIVSVQWARDFWFDDNPATLPGNLTQTTVGVDAEYGIAPGFALDLAVGVSTVNYQGGPLAGIVLTKDNQNVRRGLTDTRFGLFWRIVAPAASSQAITIRASSTPSLTGPTATKLDLNSVNFSSAPTPASTATSLTVGSVPPPPTSGKPAWASLRPTARSPTPPGSARNSPSAASIFSVPASASIASPTYGKRIARPRLA